MYAIFKKFLFALFLFPLGFTQHLSAINYAQHNSLFEERMPIVEQEAESRQVRKEKKDWTFLVYIAADNDLKGFAARNIKQMAAIGSNHHINIIVHLDIRIAGNKKITRHYYVEKDKIVHLNADDPSTQRMDSGSPDTLVAFGNWGISNYPAHKYALILWNHGSGIIDPAAGKLINPSNFFRINPMTNKWELDRTIGFLDFINTVNHERGVCWDDTTGNYLTNQTLDLALNKICNSALAGGKFSIIGFDTCLMSMIEIANIVRPYAELMVSSQEVEMGYGWRYDKVLAPFMQHTLDTHEFAQHIVAAYQDEYSKKTDDYTLSALLLDRIESIESNISSVAGLLREALTIQSGSSIKNMLRASTSKLLCTHFDEPSYKDLHHFYQNLKSNLKHATFMQEQRGQHIVHTLQTLLNDGSQLIKQAVLANATGNNLSKAGGISIYFPENKIHSSYRKTIFAQTNQWFDLLKEFLS